MLPLVRPAPSAAPRLHTPPRSTKATAPTSPLGAAGQQRLFQRPALREFPGSQARIVSFPRPPCGVAARWPPPTPSAASVAGVVPSCQGHIARVPAVAAAASHERNERTTDGRRCGHEAS